MVVYLIFVSLVLLTMVGILLANVTLFPRLKRGRHAGALPSVSVLIPARDEAAVIGETLSRLVAQDYPNLEILVLDDGSTDSTADLARRAGSGVRVISGAPLPLSWSGKNWACHQLAQHASGELLLFTDADVVWNPGAVSALVAEMQRTRADLLSAWPSQITLTLAERLIVPLMAMVIMAYLPILAVHHIPLALFGASNGQCMLWRRNAYFKVGGHSAVRASVVEDVALARRVKSGRLRLRLADGAGLVGCRMYSDWATVRRGYAKNIIAGYGGVLPLLLATGFHWLVFLLPIGLLFDPSHAPFAAPLIALGITLRALSAAFTRQRVLDALLLPVSVIAMTLIAAQALYWHFRFGGPRWKGRTLSRAGHAHG